MVTQAQSAESPKESIVLKLEYSTKMGGVTESSKFGPKS